MSLGAAPQTLAAVRGAAAAASDHLHPISDRWDLQPRPVAPQVTLQMTGSQNPTGRVQLIHVLPAQL